MESAEIRVANGEIVVQAPAAARLDRLASALDGRREGTTWVFPLRDERVVREWVRLNVRWWEDLPAAVNLRRELRRAAEVALLLDPDQADGQLLEGVAEHFSWIATQLRWEAASRPPKTPSE